MNLYQLEYIVAVDKHRHFARSAEECNVTQATLSMMIKKLEEELDVIIFDRTKKPVVPTQTGRNIIDQAKNVLKEASYLKELKNDESGEVAGELHVGIIPTLAPYLLPVFLPEFIKKYPNVHLKISELTTFEIKDQLAKDTIDTGILALPINDTNFLEWPLFTEPFHVFVSGSEDVLTQKTVSVNDIDVERLWLLEEGHCLRSQSLKLCDYKEEASSKLNLQYSSGSIESLIRLAEISKGITIIPSLAVKSIEESKQQQVKNFTKPVPSRRIGMLTYRHYRKRKLNQVLQNEIQKSVKKFINSNSELYVLGIED